MIENFYNWINERHAIYQARVRGDSPPWTEDPFCVNINLLIHLGKMIVLLYG